jgi:hypothetical protein
LFVVMVGKIKNIKIESNYCPVRHVPSIMI